MGKPVVSYVVPSWNRVAWLPECLSGLLSQTEKEIEVIVVDDGSTDGTKELLDGFYAKDNRVKIIHNEKNMGAGISRNIGNAEATAPIIGVCDSDDCYPQDRTNRILRFFEKHPDGVMMTSPYIRIDYFDKILKTFDGQPFDEDAFKMGKGISYFCHPSAAYLKKDILEMGGYKPETKTKTDDFQLVEDWIASGKHIIFAPEYFLAMHRVLPDSIMSRMRGFDPSWVTVEGVA
jgi:glycosyltransferase involved in cell wall biosynthesis